MPVLIPAHLRWTSIFKLDVNLAGIRRRTSYLARTLTSSGLHAGRQPTLTGRRAILAFVPLYRDALIGKPGDLKMFGYPKILASIYLAPIIAPKCCWDLSYCWRE